MVRASPEILDASTLQRLAAEVVAAGAPGVVVLIREGDVLLEATSGYRDSECTARLEALDRFRCASQGKMFVAAMTLQLAQEGLVSLDDPIDRWLGDLIPGGSRITVRMLLNHTSGLVHYEDFPGYGPPNYTLTYGRAKVLSPVEFVGTYARLPPKFAPGCGWNYSSVGYKALGLVIESATHSGLGFQLGQRIFGPLGLAYTDFPEGVSDLQGVYSRGYDVDLTSAGAPILIDRTNVVNEFHGTGGIVSNVVDLDRFMTGLFGGKLVGDEMLTAMLELGNTSSREERCGLGIKARRFGGSWAVGHGGAAGGTLSASWRHLETSRQVIAMRNCLRLEDDAPGAEQAGFDEAFTTLLTDCLSRPLG